MRLPACQPGSNTGLASGAAGAKFFWGLGGFLPIKWLYLSFGSWGLLLLLSLIVEGVLSLPN